MVATTTTPYDINESRAHIAEILSDFEKQLKGRTYLHMGYPYNLDYDYSVLHHLVEFSINNLGDPFIESNYGVHSRAFEIAVLDWFANLWGLSREEYWGYMTACGTEGNLHGIWMGRENLSRHHPQSKICVVSSRDAHYSVWKAARMFCMEPHPIESLSNGEIDYAQLLSTLRNLKLQGKYPVVIANVGSTIKGAVDDVDKMLDALGNAGFQDPTSDFFLHLDGALFGIMLPYVERNAKASAFTIDFKNKPGIHSISVSGHKFLGSPIPCGVVITRKSHIQPLSQDISYIASRDATILGSRNGHAPLFMWYALVKKGNDGIAKDVEECIENARYLADSLKSKGIQNVLLNELSSTVVFPKPSNEDFIKRWQLACDKDICHVVVMPNVQKRKIEEFVAEYMQLQNDSGALL